jgi:hypothetical protein
LIVGKVFPTYGDLDLMIIGKTLAVVCRTRTRIERIGIQSDFGRSHRAAILCRQAA